MGWIGAFWPQLVPFTGAPYALGRYLAHLTVEFAAFDDNEIVFLDVDLRLDANLLLQVQRRLQPQPHIRRADPVRAAPLPVAALRAGRRRRPDPRRTRGPADVGSEAP